MRISQKFYFHKFKVVPLGVLLPKLWAYKGGHIRQYIKFQVSALMAIGPLESGKLRLRGSASDSRARSQEFEHHDHLVVSLDVTLNLPKLYANYPGSGGNEKLLTRTLHNNTIQSRYSQFNVKT